MNIAIIIPDLCGGGAERSAQIIGDYYVERGENVYYFLLNTKNKPTYNVQGKIIYIDIEEFRHGGIYGGNVIYFLENLLKASSVIKRNKRYYKIDVTFSLMAECNYLSILSRDRDKIIVGVRTFMSARDDLKRLFYNKKLIRLFYNRADAVVGCSESVSDDLRVNYGVNSDKVFPVANGYIPRNHKVYHLDWEYGEKAIIVIARLDPIKQHDRIIKAFTYVKKNCADAKLILLGGGYCEPYLKWFCEQMDISSDVIFAGFVPDIEYYLKNSRIFVMASVAEGLPNGMIEAMSCGVPVVTIDTPGGCRDIIGKNGKRITDIEYCQYGVCTPYMKGKAKLINKLDEEERKLGEAMYRLLSDDVLYEHYVKKSFERAEDYTYEKMINEYNKLVYS